MKTSSTAVETSRSTSKVTIVRQTNKVHPQCQNYRMKPLDCFPTEHLVSLQLLKSLQKMMIHLFWNAFTCFALMNSS